MSVQHGTLDAGIQPFQKKDDESIVDFLEKQTWFEALRKFSQKHSEFMQPFANPGDFPGMEYGYPDLDGPGGLPPSQTDIEINNPYTGLCVLACYSPLYCDQDIECHFMKSETPPGVDPFAAPSMWQMSAWEWQPATDTKPQLVSIDRLSVVSHLRESDLDAIIKQGSRAPTYTPKTTKDAIFPIRVAAPDGGWPKWPDNPYMRVRVIGIDAAGNECSDTVDVICYVKTCCDEPTYVAVSFDDDNTADTIARSSSISVYIENGCPPFDWTVSGTGFTLGSAQTDERVNTLTADGSACGSATITITDDCGNSDTGYVRCTEGTWTDGDNYCYKAPTTASWTNYTTPSGNQRYKVVLLQVVFGGLACDAANFCFYEGVAIGLNDPAIFVNYIKCESDNQYWYVPPPGDLWRLGGPWKITYQYWECVP